MFLRFKRVGGMLFMKLVQINEICGSGSTGKICVAVSRMLTAQGMENYILYASGKSDFPQGKKYMYPREAKLQALKSRIFGNFGFNSRRATRRMLAMLDEIGPDIVHLHNLHGHNCDLRLLFGYLKEKKIKVFWTFHDCWAFTGYCPHYDMAGCGKWKTGCGNCPLRKKYSWFFDRSSHNYEKKKELFTSVDLTIITPSHWLAEQVRQSFLHKCKIEVIPNGVDLSLFQPTESDFRERYGLQDRKIVLGVAFGWGKKKGLDVFCQLAERLGEDYKIVLVGTNDAVDKQLPENILSIYRTHDQRELAQLYTAADVFVNPTREEVLGLTNIESLACGTPVITFNTGGSPECIDATCGIVVPKNDISALERTVRDVCEQGPFTAEACRKRAACFDERDRFREYLKLYGL